MVKNPFKARAALSAVFAAFVLFGCAAGQGGGTYSRDEAKRAMIVQFATVESVRPVQIEGTKTPIGTLSGAAIGGVAGSSIGGHRESAIGAVVGVVVGGLAGSAIEEGVTRKPGLEITVRLDNEQYMAVIQEDEGERFTVGERVRVLRDAGVTRIAR